MSAKVWIVLVLTLGYTLLGCSKPVTPVTPATATNAWTSEGRSSFSAPDLAGSVSDPDAPGYDPQARAESLRTIGGPFFIEPGDTVVEVRVFKPHEQRTYTLEDKEDHHEVLFMYVDAPPDLIDRVGKNEYGAPKVGRIKDNGKFKNEKMGNRRVSTVTTGDPPWELTVENLTDEPLLFQIVKTESEMSEEQKAAVREMKANRQRAANEE